MVQRAVALLVDKAALLDEYFKIKIETEPASTTAGSSSSSSASAPSAARLVSVPVLLEGHLPEPHALPMLLLRLSSEVDWAAEQVRFCHLDF